MRIEYPHSLPKTEVYEILDSYFDFISKRKLDKRDIDIATKSWNAAHDVMNVTIYGSGTGVNARAIIEEDKVIIEGKLPLLTIPFSRKIKRKIIHALEDLL